MRYSVYFRKTALSLAILGTVGAVQAQTGDTIVEEIVTIGTRVEGRTATQTPVPVDIISAESLQNIGESELGPMLQKTAPSFNFSRTTIGDGTDLMRPATLRGLGPDQVLVLVNGKRRHSQAWVHIQQQVGRGSNGTDLNTIPAQAIERIEVLRDGAAAQYGSDAIAGVINLVLKDEVDTLNLSTKYGITTHGDGEMNWTSANGGVAIGNGGFFNITAEYSEAARTDRADGTSRTEILPSGPTIFRIGNSEIDKAAAFYNAGLPLAGDMEVYIFGGWSRSAGESGGFYRWPDQADRAVLPVYPVGFLPLQVTETEDKSIALGLRGDLNSEWHFDISYAYGENEFSFGAKNSINASIAAEYVFNNGIDASDMANWPDIAANAGPTSADAGAINFEQQTFNFDIGGSVEIGLPDVLFVAAGLEYRDEDYNIDEGDSVSYSCGLDPDNRDPFPSLIDPDTFANCAFQAFPGYSPETAARSKSNRDSRAAYLDFETNFTPAWLVGLAARYEDFSDAGDELTGKLSTRIEVSENFAVRAAVSTGFRAPALAQRGFTTVITDAGPEGLRQTFHAPEGHPVAVAYGIDQLEHETSQNYSLGAVWDVTDAWTLTLDLYRIEIDDRVVLGGVLDGTDNPAATAALAAVNAAGGQFFSNAIDTKTDGLDLVSTYDMGLGDMGDMRITALLHMNDTEVENINAPAGVTEDQIFAPAQRDLVESGQPGERASLAFDWDQGNFSASLRFNYYGEVETSFWTCQGVGIPAADCAFLGLSGETSIESDSAVLTDLELRYSFENGLKLTVGGNNIFDEQPDELPDNAVHRWITEATGFIVPPGGPDVQPNLGNFKYPWESTPYGTDGAFFYGKIDYSF